MNKSELASKLANQLDTSKKAGEDMIAAFEEIITRELMAGGEVTIAGFGTFSAKERKGRLGVNPQNPSEKIQIPSVIVPKFKAGKALKDALKGKGKLNEDKNNIFPPPSYFEPPSTNRME